MKIGIFTFHCVSNYGAVLQTYCLQEVIKSMGHEVYVIDYRPKYLMEPYKVFSYDSSSSYSYIAKCKGFVRACLVTPIRWKRNRTFSKFVKNRLNLYKLDLNDESNDFDAFVFGSDQIWNPKITCGFDKVYLGDFPAAKGKKLIAYAASVGSVSNLQSENIGYFLGRLKCFDKVFVREESLADYINQEISPIAKVVLDPVLLGGMTVLNTLLLSSHKPIHNGSYLLLFQLLRNDHIAEYAMDFADKKGLDIVELATMAESLLNRKMEQTLSVERLLLYIKNSSYVITTSFHGTVLSILQNKQFHTISVTRYKDERILCLLKKLNILDRMLAVNDRKISLLNPIDYDIVNNLYERKKVESRNILYQSLSCR